MKKNILVTGGAGFIGSHLVELLLTKPDYHVLVADDLSSGRREYLPVEAEFFELDICTPQLEQVFSTHRIDTVVHLAAQTMVGYSVAHPDEDARLNILGGINVMECMRKYNVKNIIFASSAAVYGDDAPLPITETAPVAPTSFYGLTKLTWEKYLAIYAELYGMQATVLRFANVYGPRQGDAGEGGVISIFAKCIRDRKPLHIFGDGRQTRDFIYVGDIVKAIADRLTKPVKYEVLNVSTYRETSLLELIATLESLLGYKLPVNFLPPRPGDILNSVLDNTKITADGLRLDTDLAQGLQALLRDILQQQQEGQCSVIE